MKKFTLALTFIAVSLGMKAQEVKQNYTLSEAIQYGLQNNRELKNAKNDVIQADHKIWETTAIGLPQISAEGQFVDNVKLQTILFPSPTKENPDNKTAVQFGSRYNLNGVIKVNQLLFSGEYLVGLQASKTYKTITEQHVQKTEIEMKANIANAFYTVIAIQNLHQVTLKIEKNVSGLLSRNQKIFAQGMIEKTDVQQLQYTLLNIKNAVKNAERQIELATIFLKLEMGMSVEEQIQVSANEKALITAASQLVLSKDKFILENNISYQMALNNVHAQELLKKQQMSAYLPQVSAFAQHQQQGLQDDFGDLFSEKYFGSTMWGVGVSVPIFSSGSRIAKVQQAKIEVEKANVDFIQAQEGLKSKDQQTKIELLNALETYQAKKDGVKLAESIMNNIYKKQQEGLASMIDFSQTQNQYLSAQQESIQAMMEVFKAKVEVQKLNNTIK